MRVLFIFVLFFVLKKLLVLPIGLSGSMKSKSIQKVHVHFWWKEMEGN